MNWNSRINNYNSQIKALLQQGWITSAEAAKANFFKSDTQYQQLIQSGKNRAQASADKARQKAALARVGGLAKPGATLTDDYYKRFANITKSELNMFQKSAVPVKLQQFKQGQGIVDKWTETVPEIDYVVRERYMAAYDPSYANKQLKGNRKYEIQSQATDKYVSAIKSFLTTAYQNQNPFTPPKTRSQTQYAKATRASFGTTRPSFSLSNMNRPTNGNKTPQKQSFIKKAKPASVGQIGQLKKATSFFGTNKLSPIKKAKPKTSVRARF